MSTAAQIAKVVVGMPREFHLRGRVSIRTLLEDSGYNQNHDFVDVETIEDALRANPDMVKDWVEYSEGKRTSSGWYIRQQESSNWEVGYYGPGGSNQVSLYDQELLACAAFVKLELEAIREHSLGWLTG